ncbi:MAG: DsrE family protein [Candidatus Eisenbacteria bacterium]
MKILFILNDAPYGSERSYNGLRLAGAARRHGATVGACGTCLDARGIGDAELVPGTRRSSLEELTAWTLDVDRVIAF